MVARKNPCCVPDCPDKTSKRHRFPKDDLELTAEWINRINPKLGLDLKKVFRSLYVCDRHFAENVKVVGTKRGIRLDAVPTLYLPVFAGDIKSVPLSTSSGFIGNEEINTSNKDFAKSLPSSGNGSINNKENSAVDEDLAKLVAEWGLIPTIHLTPLQNLQRNESDLLGPKNQKSTESCSGNYTPKASSKDDTEKWGEDVYAMVLCEVMNSTKDENIIKQKVCRTCLGIFNVENTVVIHEGSEIILLGGVISAKAKLYNILPFIDLNISEKPVVVCKRCEKLIHKFYSFKQLCQSSEMRLRHAAIAAKKTLPDLLKIVKNLVPLSEVDENILHTPYIFLPLTKENEVAENDEIVEGVNDKIVKEVNDKILKRVNDKTVEEVNDKISDVHNDTTDEIIIDETTNDITNKVTQRIVVVNDEMLKPTEPPINLIDLNEEANLSDVNDGWQWDMIRCDPLEKPNPNKKQPQLKDHDYASECEKIKPLPKLKNTLADFNWRFKELDVFSEEFSDYLRHRKGKAPEFYILRKLISLNKPINGEGPYLCELCGHVSQELHLYHRHLMVRHEEAKKLVCPICGKLILERNFHLHHKFNHSTEETSLHRCHKCGKCFPKRKLLIHMNIHKVREKKFQCIVCHKMYHTRYQLKVHQRSHSEKEFKCKYCFLSFHCLSDVRKHFQRKHETRESLQCHICNKGLKYKHNFEEHIKAHVNDNKFKCDHCPESFRKKITWEIHTNKVHLNINFPCKYCKRKYYTPFNLNKHLEYVHHKKLHSNFWCCKCRKGYIREELYKQHLITTHGFPVEVAEKHEEILLSDAEEELIEYIEVNSDEKEESYHAIEENYFVENVRKVKSCHAREKSCHAIEENYFIEESHAREKESGHLREESCHAIEQNYFGREKSYQVKEEESFHVREKESCHVREEESCHVREKSCHAIEENLY